MVPAVCPGERVLWKKKQGFKVAIQDIEAGDTMLDGKQIKWKITHHLAAFLIYW